MADKKIWDLDKGSFGTSSKIPVGNPGDITEYIEGLDIVNYIGTQVWRPSFGDNSIENIGSGGVRVGDDSLGFNTSALQIYDDEGSSNVILGSDIALFGSDSTDNFILGRALNTSGLRFSYILGNNHFVGGSIGGNNDALRVFSDGNIIGDNNVNASIISAGTTIGNSTGNVATIGGNNNMIGDNVGDSVIVGGSGNSFISGVQQSVILGGSGIVGTENDTVYTEKINNAAKITTTELKINTSTPPIIVDGDIWFDGINLKMRIGGVTKTFTMV